MTGAAWNVTNPDKPWCLFDPDARLPIPMDWSEWLEQVGATYASHEIIVGPELEEVTSSHSDGIITVLVQEATGQAAAVGTKYPVTCRITATAGPLTIRDDRTVYLKIVER